VRFVVLGPVQVEAGGRVLPINRAQRRAVLAYLLLHRDRTVSADELVDALWGAGPPATARTQIFAAVSAIRRVLRDAGDDPIASNAGGYRLDIGAGELDLVDFHERVEAARAQAPRSPAQAAATVRDAMRLWQGEPLSGITAAFAEPARSGLLERRLEALGALYRYELAAGHHQQVLAELTDLVTRHPFSEALAGHLMLALHRSGRSAEALAVFRDIRRRLVAELGIEPASDLELLHKGILADDPALRPAPGPAAEAPRRRFLPRDIHDFTGRAAALARLDELADEARRTNGAAIVSAIGGVAGVGKTALATHWAHRSLARYPDGQLYLNLRGYDARDPMGPSEALTLLLRALDVPPARIPHEPDEMAALYRSVIAGQRILVLLDNARSVAQVRPLLPSGPGVFALVTSRDKLGGLIARDGARRLDLDLLPEADAVDLLANILGADRVAAEPAAAAELAAACGHLPLALRIAAANLVGTPERPIAAYRAELAAGDRIPALAVQGDPQSDLTQVLTYSYRALTEPARRMFRLLGLLPGPDFSAAAAAALAGIGDAGELLAALAEAYLLTGRPGERFVMHDLLREYAARLAGEAEERREALDRYATWFDRHVQAATARMYPAGLRLQAVSDEVFADPAAAGRWLEAELDNLTALVLSAADIGRPELAWRIPYACRDFLFQRTGRATTMRMAQAALDEATRQADPRAEAAAELVLAQVSNMGGQGPRALEHATRCLAKAQEAGWPHMQIDAYNAISVYNLLAGRLRASADAARRAFDLSRDLGVPTTQHTGKLGLISLLLGDLREAAAHLEQTLASQTGQVNHSRGITLLNLGETYRLLGRFDDAHERVTEAVALFEQVGNPHLAAVARGGLVLSHLATGHVEHAWAEARAAWAVLEESDDRLAQAQLRHAYGLAAAARGRHDDALRVLGDGLTEARTLRNGHPAILLMTALAEVRRAAGHSAGVEDLLSEAAEQARAGEFAVPHAQALDLLAAAYADRGDTARARETARRTMELADRTGWAPQRYAPAILSGADPRDASPAGGGS
jgi:DNA-binding SARP family transcriptional activator